MNQNKETETPPLFGEAITTLLPRPGSYWCRGGGCQARLALPGLCSSCGYVAETKARREAISGAAKANLPKRWDFSRWTSPELAMRIGVVVLPDGARLAGSEAVDYVHRSMASLGEQGTAVLLGPAGSGRTSLSVAWLRAEIESGCLRSRFVPAHDLSGPSWIDGTSLYDLAVSAHRIVIDDIGEELFAAPRESGLAAQRIELMTRLIRSRHDQGMGHVITSARSASEIAKTYGDGIARRIFEHATIIRLERRAR